MEEGKTYKVVYFDGDRDRVKDLVFKRKDGKFFIFFNSFRGIEEMISEDRVIRTEEIIL
jgi:hypothetical protein